MRGRLMVCARSPHGRQHGTDSPCRQPSAEHAQKMQVRYFRLGERFADLLDDFLRLFEHLPAESKTSVQSIASIIPKNADARQAGDARRMG